MTDWIVELTKAIWILLPAYFASASPVIFHDSRPMDFGKKWFDGNRIFGDNKTFGGFLVGVFSGTLCGFLQTLVQSSVVSADFQIQQMTIILAFVISVGALSGDLAGSFIKRRFNMKPGEDAPFLDQLNFVFGAAFFAMWFTQITLEMFFIMLVITPVLHRFANIIAYRIRAKRVPW